MGTITTIYSQRNWEVDLRGEREKGEGLGNVEVVLTFRPYPVHSSLLPVSIPLVCRDPPPHTPTSRL